MEISMNIKDSRRRDSRKKKALEGEALKRKALEEGPLRVYHIPVGGVWL